jgi:hypothetical protein
MRQWFGAIMMLILSSCGYRFGQGVLSEQYSTISVPYIEGDRDGDLTADLIKQMSSSGAFTYASSGGDLILLAKVVDYNEQNIGFRYDRKKSGRLKDDIIPSETRMQIVVDVSLVDAVSGSVLRGPTRITASVDFDHDYYTTRNRVNIFSLGQLSDIDEARDAVLSPLHQKVSRNIVDYITYSW